MAVWLFNAFHILGWSGLTRADLVDFRETSVWSFVVKYTLNIQRTIRRQKYSNHSDLDVFCGFPDAEGYTLTLKPRH